MLYTDNGEWLRYIKLHFIHKKIVCLYPFAAFPEKNWIDCHTTHTYTHTYTHTTFTWFLYVHTTRIKQFKRPYLIWTFFVPFLNKINLHIYTYIYKFIYIYIYIHIFIFCFVVWLSWGLFNTFPYTYVYILNPSTLFNVLPVQQIDKFGQAQAVCLDSPHLISLQTPDLTRLFSWAARLLIKNSVNLVYTTCFIFWLFPHLSISNYRF